jgi:hypothetical protein
VLGKLIYVCSNALMLAIQEVLYCFSKLWIGNEMG